MNHHLPCPICQSEIPLNLQLLARGASLRCPNATCGAAIGIASQSLAQFSDALGKFERLEALRGAPKGAPRR
jgi:hypothetical protein